MTTIQFETGQKVNFDGTPTQNDIDEVAKSLNIQPKAPAPQADPNAPAPPGSGFGGITHDLGNSIGGAFKSGVGQFKEGYAQTQAGLNSVNPIQAVEGGMKTAAGAINTITSPLAPIFSPISAGINAIANKTSNSPTLQKFASSPLGIGVARVAEDVGNASTIAGAVAGGEKAAPPLADGLREGIGTLKDAIPESLTKPVDQLRQEKVSQGFKDQNATLKSVNNAFKKNTKSFTTPEGVKTTVTPVDTLAKYKIAPVVEKGTINMGSYSTGEGALGKIREQVAGLDDKIEQTIKDNGKGVSIDTFKNKTISAIKNDEGLQQSGKVSSTVKKIGQVFDDYKKTYGKTLSETQINAIRKTMNQDFHPDTMDVSHAVGNAARDIIHNITPDQQVKGMLREQGNLLSAKKYAEAINGTKVANGKIGNHFLRGVGAVAGATLPKVPVIGPIMGALGGEAVARGLQQLQFKNPIAEARGLFIKK